MTEKTERFYVRWFDEDSPRLDQFGLLLALTFVAVVVKALIDIRDPAESVGQTLAAGLVTVLGGATLALAMRAAGVHRRIRRFVDVFVWIAVIGIIVLLVVELAGDPSRVDEEAGAPSVVWLLMAALAPVAVVLRLVRHRRVTTGTLYGSIAAYLLISNAFYFAFLTADRLSSTPYFGTEESTTAFMYFSLTTITTLGYGDLAPQTDVGRLLATSEAVIGQVYLVTFVALVVGLFVQHRQSRMDD